MLFELAGVLVVGTLTVVDGELFPDQTVWSGYGSGYGFVPLVLPVLGLLAAARHPLTAHYGRPAMSLTAEQAGADLRAFVDASPSPFHAVAEMVRRLSAGGFTPLDERERWSLAPGDARYVVRDGGSVIAFRVGSAPLADAGAAPGRHAHRLADLQGPPALRRRARRATGSSASSRTAGCSPTPGSTASSPSPAGWPCGAPTAASSCTPSCCRAGRCACRRWRSTSTAACATG